MACGKASGGGSRRDPWARQAVPTAEATVVNLGGFSLIGHSGSSPSPFDAVPVGRLAGSQGSHPLHSVAIEELVRPSNGAVSGDIRFDRPAVVGEGITGTVRIVASSDIEARKAYLRLVGLCLVEHRKTREEGAGNTRRTEQWVEANGTIFAHDAFLEPAIPTRLSAGEAWEAPFAIPAPDLGPPSAHLGEAIVAWAVEVRWDVAMSDDPFVAALLPLVQHPDLLRAGVGKQGGQSLAASFDTDGATISIPGDLPARIGQPVLITASWPGAPGGRGARIEIHRRTNCPNGVEGVIAAAPVTVEDLQAGSATASLVIPEGSAPSFDGAGLEVLYVVRILVDRQLRSDVAIERPLGVA